MSKVRKASEMTCFLWRCSGDESISSMSAERPLGNLILKRFGRFREWFVAHRTSLGDVIQFWGVEQAKKIRRFLQNC